MAAAKLGARALALIAALVAADATRVAAQSAPTSAPASGRQTAIDFRINVVRVIPKSGDGQDAASGFGIVVGEREGRLFIATPDHVVRGSEDLGGAPDVIFFSDQGRRVPARRLEEVRIPAAQGDLAVIEVARPAGYRPVGIAVVAPADVPDAAPIWSIGRTERWLVPTSPGGYQGIDVQTNHLMVEDLPTPPGSSGGAVLTERALLGMTLRDSGAQRITFVFRADRLVEAFRQWQLPVNFLARTSPPPSLPATASAPTVSPSAPSPGTPPSPPKPATGPATTPRPSPSPQLAAPVTPRPPASPRAGDECDRLAASPGDPQRPASVPGVDAGTLATHAEAAMKACETAFRQSPATARYGYQLARTFWAQRRYAESIAPARAAAEGGSVAAAAALGAMYRRGVDIPVDIQQSLHWYRRAAAAGDAVAQFNLATMLVNGEAPRDDAEAFKWMKAAADQDHRSALTQVGMMYERGRGTSVDYSKAREAYERAAAKGDEEAKRGLARLSQSFGTPFVRPSQR